VSAIDAPAHWSPQKLAATIIFEGDVEHFMALLPDDMETIATLIASDQTHLILSGGHIRLRVCVTPLAARAEPIFIVPSNHGAPIRLATLQQFHALRSSKANASSLSPFALTPYHRQHLVRLLAIADAAEAGATAREIAFGIVFPNNQLDTARDWKGSSEQRQTRRLTREAERMVAGGFWRFPCFAPD
jgi:hypothetical protein